MRTLLVLSRLLILLTLLSLQASCGSSAPASPGGPDSDIEAPVCSGVLCGQPASCCEAGNECVQGTCVETCESGVRCGADFAACCASEEVCLALACIEPGPICGDSYDCMPGEFCETTIGHCLPQPNPLLCEVKPDFSALDVTVESFLDRTGAGDFNEEIISIPVVADIDGDGFPEVVVSMSQQEGTGTAGFVPGRIVVLDGRDVSVVEQGPFAHNPNEGSYGSHGRATMALADVNGDGLPDIIFAARPTGGPTGAGLASDVGPIVAMDYQGNLIWTSHTPAGQMTGYDAVNAAVTAVNLDADPESEIVIGGVLIDHDGTVLADVGAGVHEGSNQSYLGGISAVADLDNDGMPEIITGKNAWKVSITAGTPAVATVSLFWTSPGADGYPGVADFDGDQMPEVVVVGDSTLRVINGQDGTPWCGKENCSNSGEATQPIELLGGTAFNRGGPPTIADFDNDGRVEVGVAGGSAYTVYDVHRPNEVLDLYIGLAPASGAIFPRWTQPTSDASSNSTGSSVFDFQGDGEAEVVYADECYMRVFGGSNGTIRLEVESTSATIHEYPLVVDVDADGNSEILIVSQRINAAADCSGTGVTPRQGLYVYGDSNDEWVPTRRVWTQHSYHVTNSDSAGNPPLVELDNWTQPELNNYRQNVQGVGVFNAPDLAIDLFAGLDGCATGDLALHARVSNIGSLGVPAGISVEFFAGEDANGQLVGMGTTAVALLPGQATTVSISTAAPLEASSYFARVDGDDESGTVDECDESNNAAALTEVACALID